MSRQTKSIFGTKEWAQKNANCVDGCAHDCHYCYAKCMAIRFKRKTSTTWKTEDAAPDRINAVCRGSRCRVMFPSTHDISPGTLDVCLTAIKAMLDYGHQLLIVSKPHRECIEAICNRFGGFKNRILFRFTIGSADSAVLSVWEPNAPSYEERLQALQLASQAGFNTSVSCEPMLDDRVELVVEAVSPFVTDAVWIGKANQLRQRLRINGAEPELLKRAEELIASQSDDKIHALYAFLRDHPQIKWKESIKKIVGLAIPQAAGLDI